MTKTVVDKQTKLDMRTMYEGRATLTQVAEKYGFATNTVKAYILEVGGTIRPRGRQVGFQATTTPRKANTVDSDMAVDVEEDTIDNVNFYEYEDTEEYDSDVEYENYN